LAFNQGKKEGESTFQGGGGEKKMLNGNKVWGGQGKRSTQKRPKSKIRGSKEGLKGRGLKDIKQKKDAYGEERFAPGKKWESTSLGGDPSGRAQGSMTLGRGAGKKKNPEKKEGT